MAAQLQESYASLEQKVEARTRELAEKGRQLELASQHKSQFLANMSHELRTPMNAILGYTELIMDHIYGEVPKKIGEVLERVQQSGHHLLDLINDVLDISKMEAGQLTLALNDYSLAEVVQTVFSAVESLAVEKGLALTVALPADLPPGKGDERRLAQVLLNLLGNAIKFTEVGEVQVRVTAADGAFTVAVSDTGPGISDTDQQKIFEAFQQADSSITRKKVVLASGYRSSGASSRCMAGASGSNRAWGRVLPSGLGCRSASSSRRRRHEHAHPGRRRSSR